MKKKLLYKYSQVESLPVLFITIIWISVHIVDTNSSTCTFAYTQDNHTSVLGMRELVSPTTVNLLCLTQDEAAKALNDGRFSLTANDDNDDNNINNNSGNSLFVYPAQSNFSGTKYPLKWIDACRRGALDRYVENRIGRG